jgi:serine/threonine-protein kinase
VSTTKVCTQCGAEYDLNEKFCPKDGSPLRFQSADDPLIGQMVADRYQILSLIGEGGMGRVYLAEHVRMGRKSAVKVINPALATTADAISRFNREAANACKINHPNVAQVYDFGEMADGTLYLAMEYIDGETLDAIVAREGPLPPARAAQITKQIADALFAAHHLGIVHRDLKPENVMVARHLDGSDWVKVVDFGIAKTIQRDGYEGGSQTVTMAGVSLGTPEYMSPEQLAGERLDHRTDVYSLGLVLFNMLTGELPYPKVTSKETLVRRLTSRARSLSEVRPEVAWPEALQRTLDRALAPEVGERFDSVGEFGREVVRAVESALVTPTMPVAEAPASRSIPAPASLPNVTTEEERLDRPIPHRRALPWIVATTLIAGATVVIATLSTRQKRVAVGDSVAQGTAAVAPAVVSTLPPVAAPPAMTDSMPHRSAMRVPMPPTAPRYPYRAENPGADLGQRLADSIRRSMANLPLTDLVRVDSLLVRLGPVIEQARRSEAARGARLPLQHYWLSPSGDSVDAEPLPPDAPLADRTAMAAQEIRGHIARMQQRFADGDAIGSRREFMTANNELAILRDLDPNHDHVTSLQRELGQGARDVLVMCYRMRADSTLARGVRCESLLTTPGRFRGFRPPS